MSDVVIPRARRKMGRFNVQNDFAVLLDQWGPKFAAEVVSKLAEDGIGPDGHGWAYTYEQSGRRCAGRRPSNDNYRPTRPDHPGRAGRRSPRTWRRSHAHGPDDGRSGRPQPETRQFSTPSALLRISQALGFFNAVAEARTSPIAIANITTFPQQSAFSCSALSRPGQRREHPAPMKKAPPPWG
jgi:hypothetical protein